jgi:hypothetical protein
LLLRFADGEGRSPIGTFVFVLPATVLRTNPIEGFRTHLGALLAETNRTLAPDISVDDRIQIVTPPDLAQETILTIVAEAPQRSVIIVCDAASFRADGVVPHVPAGSGAPTLAEDFWVPHLHALGQAVVEAVRSREVYVVLDAGQTSPYRPDLKSLLESIPGVGLLGGDTGRPLGPLAHGRSPRLCA